MKIFKHTELEKTTKRQNTRQKSPIQKKKKSNLSILLH